MKKTRLLIPLVLYAGIWYFYHYFFSATPCNDNNCFFSQDFEAAQRRFEDAISAYKHAKYFKIPLEPPIKASSNDETCSAPDTEIDLSRLATQFAIFPGRKNSLLIHISGINGASGLSGSAIQLAVLKSNFKFDPKTDPTVIFVHGFNPFGMKHLRRVNENNVNLYRNCVTREIYDERQLISNSTKEGSTSALLNLLMASTSYFNGLIDTSNFDEDFGLNFGGHERSHSHLNFAQFLKENVDTNFVKSILMIDVNTGKGPYSSSTLHISQDSTIPPADIWNLDKTSVILENASEGGVECFLRMFPNAKKRLKATHFFGTISEHFVRILSALDVLNWNHHITHFTRQFFTKFAFQVSSLEWQTSVLQQGFGAFHKAWRYLQKQEKDSNDNIMGEAWTEFFARAPEDLPEWQEFFVEDDESFDF